MQHAAKVISVAFSPDGRHLVTASEDRTARVWDAGTGQPVSRPLPHHATVNSAVFGPNSRLVVTASDDTTARVWEAVTGIAVGAPMQHAARVVSAEFSPDGERVVTAAWDRTAAVWLVRPVCCQSQQDADKLASLGEIVSGVQVTENGVLAPVSGNRRDRMAELVRSATRDPSPFSLDWLILEFGRRFHVP